MPLNGQKKKSKKQLMQEKIALEESKLTDSEKQLRAEQRRRAQKKKRKQTIKTIVIIAVVLLVVGFLAWRWFSNNVAETKKPQNVYVVGTRTITNVLSGTGSVQPADTYNVAASVQGDIIAAPIVEGADVQKGDVLYEIDSSDAETSIKNAKNSLRTAQLSYSDVAEGYDDIYAESEWTGKVTRLDVEVGDTVSANQSIGHVLDDATMLLDVNFFDTDANEMFVGQAALVTVLEYYETIPGTITEIDAMPTVTSTGAQLKNVTIAVANPGTISPGFTATATVNDKVSAESGTFSYNEDAEITAGVSGEIVSLMISEGGSITEGQRYIKVSSTSLDKQLERAAISLDNAKTSYDNALEKLEDYKITAPISGTVIEKKFNLGETIDSESGNIVAVIYDMSHYTFDMNIDELDITSISLNQSVKITCDARSGSVYEGYVSKISKQGTSQNGVTSYPVTIKIEDPLALEELLPGMNVDAEIVVKTVENVVALPVEAVGRGNLVTVIKAEDVEKYGVTLLNNRGTAMQGTNMTMPEMPEGDKEAPEMTGTMPEGGKNALPAEVPENVEGKLPETPEALGPQQELQEAEADKMQPDAEQAADIEAADADGASPVPDGGDENLQKPMAPENGMPKNQGAVEQSTVQKDGEYGTISADATSENVRVTLGISDDDFVQVISGVEVGDVVVVQETESSEFGMFGMGGGMMGGGMPGGDMGGGGMPGGGMPGGGMPGGGMPGGR